MAAAPATQAGGLRHLNNFPTSWGRSPTCPGISFYLLRHCYGGTTAYSSARISSRGTTISGLSVLSRPSLASRTPSAVCT